MKMLTNYFRLEGKRSLFVLKKSIVSLVCVVLALGAVVFGVYQLMMQTSIFPKIEVGIVIEDDSQMTEIITSYISGMESVDSICNFQYVNYEQGESMLSEGELQVVIVLPASLYDELDSLQHTKATILLPEGETLGVRMFGQLLSSGVSLLQVAEAGVKASYNMTKGESMLFDRSELGTFLAMKYLFQALDRMDTYDEIVVSPMGIMSGIQFYYLAFFICICLICGLNFSYLYEAKQKALQNKLCIEGVGKIKQAFVKILLMALYLFGVELVIYIVGCILSEVTLLYFVNFEMIAVLIMMGLALAISTHFHLVYSIAKDEKQGTLLLLVSSILMVICAGLVIPQVYLPEVAQWIGNCSPLYGWSLLGQQALYGEITGVAFLNTAVWFVIELGIGVYFAWKNA